MRSVRSAWMVLSFILVAACDASGPQRTAVDALPDWSGLWVIDGPAGDVPISGYPEGPPLQVWQLLGAGAPLKGEAAAQRDRLAGVRSYEEAVQAAPEFMRRVSLAKSEGWGMPDMMESPAPMQFMITAGETLIVNYYRDVRHIYTDGRQAPESGDIWPTPWGYSWGRWEGDTLVVETIAVQPGFGPLINQIYTEATRFRERLRQSGPDRIESEMTITDPGTLDKMSCRIDFETHPVPVTLKIGSLKFSTTCRIACCVPAIISSHKREVFSL